MVEVAEQPVAIETYNGPEGIKLVSQRQYPPFVAGFGPQIEQVSLQVFHDWFRTVDIYQLDVETNVVEDITDRELYVIQFGSMDEKVQFVIDYASLEPAAKEYIHSILDDRSKKKVIHNAMFEYTIIKWCCGVDIDNIWDTMLALKVITNGKMVPDDFYSLAGSLKELFGIEMGKEEQKSFNGKMMTTEQIIYAATDVMYMGRIKNRLESLPNYREQALTIDLENQAVRPIGDIMTNGFVFNTDIWRENMEWAVPQIDDSRERVYDVMRTEFLEDCMELGFVSPKDNVTINWNSQQQRAKMLETIYPDLVNFKVPAMKKYEQTCPDDSIISHILKKNYEAFWHRFRCPWPHP